MANMRKSSRQNEIAAMIQENERAQRKLELEQLELKQQLHHMHVSAQADQIAQKALQLVTKEAQKSNTPIPAIMAALNRLYMSSDTFYERDGFEF